jgi:addiction module RelB/DinJ family antitoxin
MKKDSANLHIRLPAKLKHEAEKVLSALGLDTSSAIRLFYAQIALGQTLPFPLPALRKASPKTRKIIAEAMADEVALGPFDDAERALKALYAAT